MTEWEKITQNYVREVLRCASGSRKEKRAMRDELSRLVMQYLKENPGTDQEDVEYEFGKPEEFIADVTGVSSTAVLVRRERRERRIWHGVYAALAVGIVASFAVGLNLKAQSDRWQQIMELNYAPEYGTMQGGEVTQEDIDAMEVGPDKYAIMYNLQYEMDGDEVVSAINKEDGTEVIVDENGKPKGDDYPYSVFYLDVETKEDVKSLQTRDQLQIMYGLVYKIKDYEVISATDYDGNYVSVDRNGAPLDSDYPLSEDYLDLPNK